MVLCYLNIIPSSISSISNNYNLSQLAINTAPLQYYLRNNAIFSRYNYQLNLKDGMAELQNEFIHRLIYHRKILFLQIDAWFNWEDAVIEILLLFFYFQFMIKIFLFLNIFSLLYNFNS